MVKELTNKMIDMVRLQMLYNISNGWSWYAYKKLGSVEAYRAVREPIYRRAFPSLTIMAISFMLIFLNLLIDRIFILVFEIPGFTIFYYLAWAFTIVGIVSAYFGYIRPEISKKQ